MGTKRQRDKNDSSKSNQKKYKRSNGGIATARVIKRENEFDKLSHQDEDSDSDYIFDYNNRSQSPEKEVVLVDSDVEETNGSGIITANGQNSGKHKGTGEEGNELTTNQDFIQFGFSSSEDDNESENDEEQNIELANETSSEPNSLYPWLKDHDHSTQKEIADWLTMEMKDFVSYISPSRSEIVTRNNVVNTLKREISSFWPGTEVHVFGSSATDLYLPGSDIDMVVISNTGDYENRSRLYQLSSFLRAKTLATNVEVIANAKVPIIKFVDPQSNLPIDISFERTNGLDAARRIRKWLLATPGLRELVLVVKQFLRSRKLNNVHVGGLGGYATIIMCYHFMQLHPKISTNTMDAPENLGVLLIEFFELFGRNFSYDNLIISIDPETQLPRYLLKGKHPILNTARNTFSIVIQDPADPSNNITRSSYNLRDLKKAFGGAYQLLVAKCYELNAAPYKERLGQSILGDIIKFKGKERNFVDERHLVRNDALIHHEEEPALSSDIENDGIEGNDKYYFSDMTVESEEQEEYTPLPKKQSPVKKQTPITNKAKDTKKLVESYLSLESSPEEEDKVSTTSSKKPNLPKKPSIDKDFKRDYWRSKGLDI
ncbi:TRF5 [Candida margitis]|uniref:TRF5 n=1 Tax=Candida margitis TaxID=1775924 RepID=UPI0022277C6E|nr:TRF5 [Candida margitis]KAI5969161.1 TRF5 [Candida margitis]